MYVNVCVCVGALVCGCVRGSASASASACACVYKTELEGVCIRVRCCRTNAAGHAGAWHVCYLAVQFTSTARVCMRHDHARATNTYSLCNREEGASIAEKRLGKRRRGGGGVQTYRIPSVCFSVRPPPVRGVAHAHRLVVRKVLYKHL